MNTLVIVTLFIAILCLAMNLYVTYLVAKSEFFDPVQKYFQYGLIWLLPVIGVITCYLFVQPSLGQPSGQYVDHREKTEGEFMNFSRSNKDYFSGHD